MPAGVSYVSVEESGNDATIPAYYLVADRYDDGGSESEDNGTAAAANAIAPAR